MIRPSASPGAGLICLLCGHPIKSNECRCFIPDMPAKTFECAFCRKSFIPDPDFPTPDDDASRFCTCTDCGCCGSPIDDTGWCSDGCQCDDVHAYNCEEIGEPQITCSPNCAALLPKGLGLGRRVAHN